MLLSDVDGLYTAPPHLPGAAHLAEVAEITPEIEAMAGGAASEFSRGGMKTKLAAARIATDGGARMAIANASRAASPEGDRGRRALYMVRRPFDALCGAQTLDLGLAEKPRYARSSTMVR